MTVPTLKKLFSICPPDLNKANAIESEVSANHLGHGGA